MACSLKDSSTRQRRSGGDRRRYGLDCSRSVVRFMIVGNHDRIGHALSDNAIAVVLDGEDDLKAKFFVLVPAIASNPHRQLNLHGTRWSRRSPKSSLR